MSNDKDGALRDVGYTSEAERQKAIKEYEELEKEKQLMKDKRKIRNICCIRGEMKW